MSVLHTHASGSTSKYCCICAAPCFIPDDVLPHLTLRDRRHLSNARVLGRRGISHPALTWKHDSDRNVMACVGYTYHVYESFDPANPTHCLSVHRSCYALLTERLETTCMVDSHSLMHKLAPHIGPRGVLALPTPKRVPPDAYSHWMMCDPTDIPATPPSLEFSTCRDMPLGAVAAECADLLLDSGERDIPHQLLTPPLSPADSHQCSEFEPPEQLPPPAKLKYDLLSLPPHVLLGIVANLELHSIYNLAQTCSAFRMYFGMGSSIWAWMCHSTFAYAPKFSSSAHSASYYLKVRGNTRLERQVLWQRRRIEDIIEQMEAIYHSAQT